MSLAIDEFDSRRLRGCCVADPVEEFPAAEPGVVAVVEGEIPLLRLVFESTELLPDAFDRVFVGWTGVLVAEFPFSGEFCGVSSSVMLKKFSLPETSEVVEEAELTAACNPFDICSNRCGDCLTSSAILSFSFLNILPVFALYSLDGCQR